MTWIAVLACMAIGWPASTRQAEGSYADVLRMYRAGQFEAAVAALDDLSEKQVDDGLERVRRRAGEAGDLRILEAAALLETEAYLADRIRRNERVVPSNPNVEDLIKLLEHRDANSPFVRRWRLMMTAFHQGRQNLHAALAVIGAGAKGKAASVDADFAHAIAAIHEMAWTAKRETGRSSIDGDLAVAARELRRSLGLRRDAEAQVRLGRVLALMDTYDEAEAMLASIETDQAELRYLARLFEGDLAERRGDPEHAGRAYTAAIEAYPVGQSARMALAHVRFVAGERAVAAGDVRTAVAPRPEVLDSTDPWAWYSRGLARHADRYLQQLREMVFQPSK